MWNAFQVTSKGPMGCITDDFGSFKKKTSCPCRTHARILVLKLYSIANEKQNSRPQLLKPVYTTGRLGTDLSRKGSGPHFFVRVNYAYSAYLRWVRTGVFFFCFFVFFGLREAETKNKKIKSVS